MAIQKLVDYLVTRGMGEGDPASVALGQGLKLELQRHIELGGSDVEVVEALAVLMHAEDTERLGVTDDEVVMLGNLPLGKRLVYLRRRKGVKQKDVAAAIGFSAPYLSAVENDKKALSNDSLRNLAEYFKVPVWIFGIEA